MLISRDNGALNVNFFIKLLDAISTSGAGKTGLSNVSSGLEISTITDVEATPVIYTAAASHINAIGTIGTYSAPAANTCNFGQVDATNHPGLYQIQLANARFSVNNATQLVVSVQGAASNIVPADILIDLDNQVDLTAVGTITAVSSGGVLSVNATQINGNAVAALILQLELNARKTGTVSTASFTPTTGTGGTVFECGDITDSSVTPVYINRGVVFTSGNLIRCVGTVLTDIVGTGGRRLTLTQMLGGVPANGDTLLIL